MRLVAIGDCLVDRYASYERMFPGGSALNVAVFSARAGARASFIGAVGTDEAGRVILEGAAAELVDVSLVLVRTGESAYANVRLVAGDRIFLGSHKGVSVFDPTDEHLHAIGSSDIVHTGHSSTMESHLKTISRLAPVSFDFSYRHDADYLDRVLPHVTHAQFSAGDLDYSGRQSLVKRALEHGARSVLITRGANGAEYFENNQRWFIRAHPTKVIDTLGAGDTMIATLLTRRLGGDPPETALKKAAASAARTCTRLGAFTAGVPFNPFQSHHVITALEPR